MSSITYFTPDQMKRLPNPSTCRREELFIVPEESITVLNSNRFVNDQLPINPNDETGMTSNQGLAGQANPKTRINPIIVARPYEFEYWKDTPVSSISIMNSRKKQYPTLAGYSKDSEDIDGLYEMIPRREANELYPSNPLAQTIQPGVYAYPTDYDPINDNIGITTTPQFESRSEVQQSGNTLYNPESYSIQEDYEPIGDNPIIFTDPYIKVNENPSLYDVYDPRFTGYGANNRNYLDPMTKQTRYYYDDINAVKFPNYIVRSKIDSCLTKFGDTYGPMRRDQINLNDMRHFVEKQHLENDIGRRNDLMESLLRKRDSEMWQTREAPIIQYPQNLSYRRG